jgi:hypothetical protein
LNEDAHSLLITSDKGFLITGNCDYRDSITNLYWVKPYLIKTDSSGLLQWECVIHANDTNHTGGSANFTTLNLTSQFYYTSISHYYHNPASEKPAIGKIDLNGNVIGTYDIIQDFSNGGMSSAQFINDSTLAAVCGWGNSMEDFGHYLALIDTLGNIIDTILISADIYSGTLQICHDNKLVEMYHTYQNGQFDVYLRKLNYNLEDDTVYTMPFTYDSLCAYQIVSDTIVQDDCGLIVGVEEHGGVEAWGHGGGEAGMRGSVEIWPNPASGVLSVKCLGLSAGSSYSLSVVDIFGKQTPIQSVPFEGGGREWGEVDADGSWRGWTIDVSSLPPGIYFMIVFEDGKRVGGGKFVVVH